MPDKADQGLARSVAGHSDAAISARDWVATFLAIAQDANDRVGVAIVKASARIERDERVVEMPVLPQSAILRPIRG